MKDRNDRRITAHIDARLGNSSDGCHQRLGFDEELSSLEHSCHGPAHQLRRAMYTPTSMTTPPKIFSIPRTSPKKATPEATPVMVIMYW